MSKVKLGDVVERVKEFVDKDNTDLTFYIGGEHFESRSLTIKNRGYINGSTIGPAFHHRFRKGDVLLMSRNPHLRKAGMVDFDGICSDVSYVIRTKDENVIMQKFIPLLFQCDTFWEFAEKNKKGSTNFFLNWSDFEKFEFDLPAIEKQKKIVDVLWSIDNTIDTYNNVIKASDELVKSQFIEMFYGKDYPLKTIGDVVDRNISRVSKVFKQTDEIQYLDISSIDNTTKSVTKLTKYILKDAPSRAQYVLKEGDIVYSTVRPNLQNIAINRSEDKNVVGSTGFCILRCKEVTSGYMWGVVTGAKFTEEMVSRTNGSNYPAVNDKTIYAYKIPIAPIEQQIEFERFVQKIDKSKFEIEKALNELKNLYQMIIKQGIC